MNLVTVMDYDWSDNNYLTMCLTWIRQAKIHLSGEDSCFIFSGKKPHPSLRAACDADGRFRFCVREGMRDSSGVFFPACGPKSDGKNFTYKLHIACQLDFPFVFMDADAFIVHEISDLASVLDDMPAAFVDHETDIKGHTEHYPPFINSGVFLVNDPSRTIMNWELILDHAKKCGFCFRFKDGRRIPGTDQSVIKSYLDSIGYAYRHEKFGIHYNSCAACVTWTKDQSGWVAKDFKGEVVKIAHYWGPFRPWSVPCPIFGVD